MKMLQYLNEFYNYMMFKGSFRVECVQFAAWYYIHRWWKTGEFYEELLERGRGSSRWEYSQDIRSYSSGNRPQKLTTSQLGIYA